MEMAPGRSISFLHAVLQAGVLCFGDLLDHVYAMLSSNIAVVTLAMFVRIQACRNAYLDGHIPDSEAYSRGDRSFYSVVAVLYRSTPRCSSPMSR